MGKLDGKVAIVTGSGRGIGREIALKLASDGAAIVVNDLDEVPAKQTVDAIQAGGGRAVACAGSVTDDGFAERFVQTAVDSFGGLDIIVNNAGYTWDSVVQKMTDEQWDAILDVHLKAPFRILRAAQPVIANAVKQAKQAGESAPCRKVANISSLAGLGGNAGQANYAAANSGSLEILVGADIALSGQLQAINLKYGVSLDIEGDDFAINGGNAERGLFVYAGDVSINSLEIENAHAVGGAGAFHERTWRL